jgi:hypothetical protein
MYNCKGKKRRCNSIPTISPSAASRMSPLEWTTSLLYYLPMQLQIPQLSGYISGATYCVMGVIAAVTLISILKSSDGPNVSGRRVWCPLLSGSQIHNPGPAGQNPNGWTEYLGGIVVGGYQVSDQCYRCRPRRLREGAFAARHFFNAAFTMFAVQGHSIQGFDILLLDGYCKRSSLRGRISQISRRRIEFPGSSGRCNYMLSSPAQNQPDQRCNRFWKQSTR